LGTAVGLGVTIFVDFNDDGTTTYPYIHIGDVNNNSDTVDMNKLQHYLGAQLVMACVALLLIAIFGGDEPPSPPSREAHNARVDRASAMEFLAPKHRDSDVPSADDESSLLLGDAVILQYYTGDESDFSMGGGPSPFDYIESVKIVFSKWRNVVYLVSYGLPIGVFYAIPVFVGQLLTFDRYGTESNVAWSPGAIGWAGLVFQLSGIAGCFIAGRLIYRTNEFRSVLRGLLGGSVISLLIFLLAATSTSSGVDTSMISNDQSTTSVSIAIVFGLMGCGLCLAAANTVGVEWGRAMTFPADEVAVGGILECSAELWGFIMVSTGAWMMDNVDYEYGDGRICFLGTLAAAVTFSLVVTVLLQPKTTKPPR